MDNTSPVVTPPPFLDLGFRLSPTIDDVEELETFLTDRFGTPFTYDDNLGPNTYRHMHPYTHIYEFNHERPYVIKFSSDPIHRPLIQHEWDMYTQLYSFDNQSYFIKGVDGGTFKGCAYTILPFIKAKSLEESLLDLGKEQIIDILNTVADALLYLLSKGICHGDMHAGNILLTDDGVKIIDFDKAGACDGQMNVGYTSVKGRKALRKDLNFIGVPYNNHTGFFIMVKDIFRKKGLSVERIDEIIQRYMTSEHHTEDIQAAYQAMKGGRRRTFRKKSLQRRSRRRRSRSRRSRVPSSK